MAVEPEVGASPAGPSARRSYDGPDCIKVIVNTGPRVVSLDEMRAIVEEAHGVRKKVAAHAIRDPATRVAVDAGVDSVEHAYIIPDDALNTLGKTGHRDSLLVALRVLEMVERSAGDFALAAEYMDESLAIAREIQARHDEAATFLEMTRLAHCRGDHSRAAALADDAMAVFARIRQTVISPRLRATLDPHRHHQRRRPARNGGPHRCTRRGKLADIIPACGDPLVDISKLRKSSSL